MKDSNIAPFNTEHQLRKSFSKKQIIITLLIVISLIAIFSIGSWLYISNLGPQQTVVSMSDDEIRKLITDADKLANSGDIESAKVAYDDAINKTSDSTQKSILLINKASVYYNEKDYDQALAIAKEAEALDSNENITAFIAATYALKGDNQKAIEYYQKTIVISDESESTDDYTEYYKAEIKLLGGVSD